MCKQRCFCFNSEKREKKTTLSKKCQVQNLYLLFFYSRSHLEDRFGLADPTNWSKSYFAFFNWRDDQCHSYNYTGFLTFYKDYWKTNPEISFPGSISSSCSPDQSLPWGRGKLVALLPRVHQLWVRFARFFSTIPCSVLEHKQRLLLFVLFTIIGKQHSGNPICSYI